MIHQFPASASPSQNSAPVWSLYGDGHVIAGTLIVAPLHVEAQILLDGALLYRSRHRSPAVAREELMALRGHWASEGWSEPN
jgi:hypothetical protein